MHHLYFEIDEYYRVISDVCRVDRAYHALSSDDDYDQFVSEAARIAQITRSVV